ncbi:MAG: putative 2-aminoethylphosphonate ABC transporter ATP-binding protein [Anaerolineales bacterium]|nr:putative 2-aminoethylphosphonate ABC transporter ATP-binding protein [Anaerolineales bacterium]
MELITKEPKDPFLRIERIRKTFGELVALDDVSLTVGEGEFVTLLGPSGCGKTTLLRIIAGLEQQNSGEIYQAGRNISRLPPRQRDFGIVFQSYALFPNLTATGNIAYGLENRKKPKNEIKERVDELLKMVGLPDAGHKYPAQLSGGQQQRIALARALAVSPGLLLLDEPLSALDARVRISLRLEIKNLQKRLGVTTVFVTHDQEEALVMSDRIVVMNLGTIDQIGTPLQVYREPASPFVADFIGMMNFIPGQTNNDPCSIHCGSLNLSCIESDFISPNSPVTVAIRPEDIRLRVEDANGANIIPARVEALEFLGSFNRLTLVLEGMNGFPVVAEVSIHRMRDMSIHEGSTFPVQLPPEQLRIYPGKVGIGS